MFLKLRVPILGMVENMSYHTCKACGHVEHVFGRGGVQRAAADFGLPVLGQVRERTGGGQGRGPQGPAGRRVWLAAAW